jgi:hypothetical protein
VCHSPRIILHYIHFILNCITTILVVSDKATDLASIPSRGNRSISSLKYPRPVLEPTQAPIQYNRNRGLFPPRGKRHGREAHPSPPSGARVQNGGATLPLSHTSSWPHV